MRHWISKSVDQSLHAKGEPRGSIDGVTTMMTPLACGEVDANPSGWVPGFA